MIIDKTRKRDNMLWEPFVTLPSYKTGGIWIIKHDKTR